MRDSRRARPRSWSGSVEGLEGRALLSGATTPLRPIAGQVQVQRLHQRAPEPTPARWAWLSDTYWYVPTANLPATIYQSGTGALQLVADQTVFHIKGYKSGYFWGDTVAQFGSGAPSSSALVGSVTPQGRVLLNFTAANGTTTQGHGIMIRKAGQWTMENQMFSISGTNQIGHWAYMVQTRPGQRSWESLPAVGVSVPTFLANYNAPSPTFQG